MVIQTALIAHRLPKINELFNFYEVVKNYAKLLDFNTLLLKQSQQCTNKTARGKAKKNDKNQPKNHDNDNWIIKKNNPHWKTKSKLNKLSKSKQKTLHDKALQQLHKQWAKDKQGSAGNNTPPVMTYQLVLSDLPAGSDGVPCVTLAHNLMILSTRQPTHRQQTYDSDG